MVTQFQTNFFLFCCKFGRSQKYYLMKKLSLLCCLFIVISSSVFAQTLPTGFSVNTVATGINKPTMMAFAPDGRLFICEQQGQIRIVKNGVLLPNNFASFTVNSNGERGLLGLAFDPNFSTNNYIYIYYTLPSAANNRLSRITANGDVMQAGSEVVLINFDPLSSATNHNGGFIKFGKDGKLYVALGENANRPNAQNLNTYLGKLLRLTIDNSVPSTPTATPPTDNPFYNSATTVQGKSVWAMGLRNPFSFDVHPTNGKIYINDVGGGKYEEVNDASTAGKNFGWDTQEGPPVVGFDAAVYYYGHDTPTQTGEPTGCAITGGTFFSPSSTNYPNQYNNKYYFIDYCNGWLRYINPSSPPPPNTPLSSTFGSNLGAGLVCMATGPDGNLYFLQRNNAQVSNSSLKRIIYTNSGSAPVITSHPISLTVQVGQGASFSVAASGSMPFSYQWKKGSTNLGTNATLVIASATTADAGTYNVVVTNSVGNATSNDATLTVVQSNESPTAQINSPTIETTFAGGQTINFSGAASDPEDGTLPASAYSWNVVFHHDAHTHPGPSVPNGVTNGSFIIPSDGEFATNVFYRIYLTVADASGNTTTVYRDIQPRVVQVTLDSSPQGLKLLFDGSPVTTPYTFNRVEGMLMPTGVVSPQLRVSDGQIYTFNSWQAPAGNPPTLTPNANTTYKANFSGSLRNPDRANTSGLVTTLSYKYYEGDWNSLPNFNNLTPRATGTVTNFSLTPRVNNNQFGFVYTGFINITAEGIYDFFVSSDEGSRLYIGDLLVVDNDGLHTVLEKTGKIGLKAGLHAITLAYFDKTGSQSLSVNYDGPSFAKKKIPNSVLYRTTSPSAREGEERLEVVDVSIFPNPASNVINIITTEAFANGNVKLLDINGRLLKTTRLVETEGEIEVEDVQAGLYLVSVQKDNQIVTKRVMIQK